MDFRDIRRVVIIAMFSDDALMQQFVLKGGNALNIVHGVSTRTSLDVDLSMADDFDDVADASARIERALRDRFQSHGYTLFDYTFTERPRRDVERRDDRWGGYRVEFKLLPTGRSGLQELDLPLARRSAVEIGPGHSRTFRVEISKHEYCDLKEAFELDDYLIYVYPPFLVAAEKLRALCQQMPAYVGRRKATARARDFYDIHAIVTAASYVQPPNFAEVLSQVFAAKQVPLDLLNELGDYFEFHRTDWPSVTAAVGTHIMDFEFYFSFVIGWASSLRTPSE